MCLPSKLIQFIMMSCIWIIIQTGPTIPALEASQMLGTWGNYPIVLEALIQMSGIIKTIGSRTPCVTVLLSSALPHFKDHWDIVSKKSDFHTMNSGSPGYIVHILDFLMQGAAVVVFKAPKRSWPPSKSLQSHCYCYHCTRNVGDNEAGYRGLKRFG